MKRTLLTLIGTLAVLVASAQLYTNDPSYGKTFNRAEFLYNIKLPVGDTLTSNTSKPGDGEFILRTIGGDTAAYIKAGGIWRRLGGGVDATSNAFIKNGLSPQAADFNITGTGGMQNLVVFSNATFGGPVSMQALTNGPSGSPFLVSDGTTVKYRLSTQVLSDIGGAPASGSINYVQINPAGAQTGGFNIVGSGTQQSVITKAGTSPLGTTHAALLTSGVNRWAIGLRNAESGSNTGSDYYLSALADNGTTVIGTHLNIQRSTGNVSLGSNNFDAKLFVNGTLKITDGTQAAGAFLKSDANGLAKWTADYVTPDDYGAAGDGVTNDATALQSAINTGRPVYIPSKTYLINTTVMVPEGTKITGNRNSSVLKSTANQVILQVQGNYVTIQGVRFLGSGKTSGNTTQRAISMISNRSKNLIEGCLFSQMGGAGVYINSIADYKGNLISNCVADSCNTGYYCDNQAEYNSFVNCFAYACQYGMRNFGGNNSLTDGSFSMNDTAIVMAFGTGNPGHATITGTRINHNIGASLVARGVTIGHTITGTMFYDNKIIIDNCTGFKFVACDFAIDSITVKNSSVGCFFTNNRIRGLDPVLNFDATSQVYWENNYNEVTTNQAPANLVVSANVTLGPGHRNVYASTSSAFTITLPPAAICPGKEYFIKKISNNLNAVTIDPNASETIDGFTTAAIFPYLGSMRIISNGTGWLIMQNSSFYSSIRTVTGNTTMDADYSMLLVNNSGTATITLPAAASNTGRKYTVKKVSAASNDVVIDPNASETIDGATTKTLTLQYSSITFESNGANWHVVSSHAAATTL